MKRVTIILTFILTLCCWKGASQGLTSISIDKIVKTIDNDKGLKAVEVTDEKYLDEMVDFNGRIVGFFNRKELRKVAVYNKYKKNIYKYCYYLFDDKPIYYTFHVSEYDGTDYEKIDKSKLQLIRGDEMYFDNNKAFNYRSFKNGKWKKGNSDTQHVKNRNQNVLDDMASFKSGLKSNWPPH